MANVTGYTEVIGEQVRNQLPVPFGVYDVNTRYTCTEFVAPLLLHDGIYYILNVEGEWLGSSQPAAANNPKTDIQINGVNAMWMSAENMKFAFIEILMAEFAKLASAVFYGNHMFSQQGIDAAGNATSDYSGFGTNAFSPNIELDFQTGIANFRKLVADGAEITNVKGLTGSFKTLQCIDSNGDVAGELKFYSGYMQFNGKFSIIGDLSATLVQGHTLSHSSTPTIVVYGSYVRYYERGPNSTYTTSYLAVDGANVYTIELIRLGICYNTIIIAYTSGTYNYELNTYRTGEVYGMNVTVINPNDNAADGSTVFWLNGKSRIIRGGGGYILSRTNPSFLNPSLPAFSRGGGWFVVSEFDNDWR